MLRGVFLVGVLTAFCAGTDLFGDLRLLTDSAEPNFQTFDWQQPQFQARQSSDSKDREPLAPDYKDPQTNLDNKDKPVLNPKKKDKKYPIIGAGIVDIDAGSLQTFSSPFGPDFEFPLLPTGLGRPGNGGFGIGGLFGLDDGKKWWKGANVCIEREESTDDDDEDVSKENATESKEPNLFSTSIRLSNCFETDNKYECVTRINNHGVFKTFTVRYKCCYGYKRTPESDGCIKEIDLKPVLQTLEDLKLDAFRGLIKSSGLESTFEAGNFTVFVPSDDAMHDYDEKLNDMNIVDPARRRRTLKNALTSKDLILSHTTDGFIELADLENEQTLKSEALQGSKIRINIYPTHTYEKMLTVNCARVKKSNILADNGVVHVIDKVIPPAIDSIEQIINNHPRLSSFKKVLENTEIPKKLKLDGHYTVFAATDEAFAKLDQVQRQKLLNGGGCATNILKHHFVAHTVCSAAIIGNATTHNVEGAVLNMERTMDDELIFEGKAKIVDIDLVGSNGVIHLIDTLIIPESGQYIGNVLKSHNFSKFQDLVQKAGLAEELDNFENATVFVPADAAFETPQTRKILQQIGNDKEKLQDLVKYHIIEGKVQSCDMSNNMKIPTKNTGQDLRVNLYSTLPLFTNVINRATINCARLIGFDEKTCGSIVHEINKVLTPPSETIYELIQNDDKYLTLRELMNGTEVEKILQENNRSVTFLAPTDETFAALDEKDLKRLREDKQRANEVLKHHILTEILCCSGVGPQTWGFNNFIPTMDNQRVEVGRTGSQVRINRAVVTSCDNLATNGVLHTINKVLAPRKQSVATLGGGFLFFDI